MFSTYNLKNDTKLPLDTDLFRGRLAACGQYCSDIVNLATVLEVGVIERSWTDY